MIPEEKQLGTYVRYLRDHGILDAVGDWRERDGAREFGVRIGGVFFSVAELRDERNRKAVLARDFRAIEQNRAHDAVREAVRRAKRDTRQRSSDTLPHASTDRLTRCADNKMAGGDAEV